MKRRRVKYLEPFRIRIQEDLINQQQLSFNISESCPNHLTSLDLYLRFHTHHGKSLGHCHLTPEYG
jgi:hypothetical protein